MINWSRHRCQEIEGGQWKATFLSGEGGRQGISDLKIGRRKTEAREVSVENKMGKQSRWVEWEVLDQMEEMNKALWKPTILDVN